MTLSMDKMRNEKIEREARVDAEMAGEFRDVPQLTRKVVWKMDVRYTGCVQPMMDAV